MHHARNLRKHLRDTVSVRPKPERNHRGEYLAPGPATEYAALVEHKPRLIAGPSGQQITSAARIYLEAEPDAIRPEDWVTLPDGTEREILATAHWTAGGFLVLEVI